MEAGNWSAPFGIVLVADTLATLMVLLTSIISTACLFFAFKTITPKREKFFFYPFYFFLLVGVNGVFLTGDILNLFVFFYVIFVYIYLFFIYCGKIIQHRYTYILVIIHE